MKPEYRWVKRRGEWEVGLVYAWPNGELTVCFADECEFGSDRIDGKDLILGPKCEPPRKHDFDHMYEVSFDKEAKTWRVMRPDSEETIPFVGEEDQKRIVAKEYVDKQLEAMKRHGSAPEDFSEEEYEGLVEEVVEAIDLK